MKTLIQTEKSCLNIYPLDDDKIIESCINEIDNYLIENPKIFIFGKPAIQHRNIGFFSDTSIGYTYSGQLAKSIPLTQNLSILLNLINTRFECSFNGILINKYKDGDDYIGAHSDDEKNLDAIGVISLSYGSSRKFRIRDKFTKKIIIDIPTNSNEIIHMKGKFQEEFTHEIPIERKIKDIRYSFTFRKHLL